MSELAINPEELAELMGSENELKPPSTPAVPDPVETPLPDPVPQPKIEPAPAIPTPQSPPPQPASPTSPAVTARPAQFAPLQSAGMVSSSTNLDMLMGVTLRVTVELGRTKMSVEEVLKIGPGSVVELDKLAGEPVDVLVNEQLIARGEVVVVDDRFGVRITDVLPPAQRLNSLQ